MMTRRARTWAMGSALLASLVVLSACGSGSTGASRAAAPEDSAASPAASAPAPSTPAQPSAAASTPDALPAASSASAEAVPSEGAASSEPMVGAMVGSTKTTESVPNVNFCLKNDSSRGVSVALYGSGGDSVSRGLGRGDEVCVNGTALIGHDVSGSIEVDGVGKVMDLQASRPALWISWVELTQPGGGRCMYDSILPGGSDSKEDGVLRYSAKRISDTKSSDPNSSLATTNFRMTLSDPKKASQDGKPRPC